MHGSKRWHVELVLANHPRHLELCGYLNAGGADWIRSNKVLIRQLAAESGQRSQIEHAIRQDLKSIPVSEAELMGLICWPVKAGHRERPRVGFVSAAYLPVGGTETFHRTLLPRLSKVCDVAGFVATGFYGGDGSLLGVPYATGVDAACKLAAHCDVIVVWGLSDLADILPADRPRVIAVHHSDASSSWSNDTILSQLDLIDSVICINAGAAERLSDCGKPVHFIPNAIDSERLIPTVNTSELRHDFGIPADSRIVLFGHRLSGEKRPVLAVEIAKQLPDDWTMVIAGHGPELGAVESSAAGCDRVRIVGPCESLASWLAISDCFLSLSIFEGFGFSVAESLAAGLPVVSTSTGIAPGLATTLPTDAMPAEWAYAICTARPLVEPAEILRRYSVHSMVEAWADVVSENQS